MDRPLSYLVIAGVTIAGIAASAVAANSASGSVSITKSRGKICMTSNGLPDHATGRFPNAGNPHRIAAQFIEVCVRENPVKTSRATELRGSTGFALNGVMIRPGTADYYDPSSPRGFSRNPASGWKLDGKGAGAMLGFEIHYVGSGARSGYTLKPGNRNGGPGGKHDGTYVQDWQYTGGAGKLDQCNGGTLNGKFVYFVTDSYPYFPHCAWGKVSRDFGRP